MKVLILCLVLMSIISCTPTNRKCTCYDYPTDKEIEEMEKDFDPCTGYESILRLINRWCVEEYDKKQCVLYTGSFELLKEDYIKNGCIKGDD